jgi:dynamin 1-like protein
MRRENPVQSYDEELKKYRPYDSYYVEKNMQMNTPSINLPPMPTTMRAHVSQENPRAVMETKIIKNLIVSYFNVVRKNINDSVPKTIMCFLVNQSKNISQRELVSVLYKEDNLNDLLTEDPAVAKQRENCEKIIITLRKALTILQEVRDFAILS